MNWTWTWAGLYAYVTALTAPPSPSLFQYPLHAVVHWSDSPDGAQPWEIAARRYTEGTFSDYVEYLLVAQGDPGAPGQWAYEPDVQEHAP